MLSLLGGEGVFLNDKTEAGDIVVYTVEVFTAMVVCCADEDSCFVRYADEDSWLFCYKC